VATNGRLWLEVVPGVVTLAGGLVLLWSRLRPLAVFGAWLAALAGAWFAVGGLVAQHWASLPTAGQPVGSGMQLVLEEIGFFTGIGLGIVFVAAVALGRFTVLTMGRVEAPAAAEPSREREAAGAGRSIARIVPVPVFRGPQRSADAAES